MSLKPPFNSTHDCTSHAIGGEAYSNLIWILTIFAKRQNLLTAFYFCSYINMCLLSFDSKKRELTLLERKLDFADAKEVFSGPNFEYEDVRKNYGERRVICFGYLHGRLLVIGYTPRGKVRHIFSMRKANLREQNRIQTLLNIPSSRN